MDLILGQRPLIIITLFFISAILLNTMPLVLKEWRKDGPEYQLPDIRVSKNLNPSNPFFRKTNQQEYQVEVFGPYITETFSKTTNYSQSQHPPTDPQVFLSVDQGEEINLPDGHKLQLIGMKVINQSFPPGSLTRVIDKEPHEVYFTPSGEKMLPEEALEFNQLIGNSAKKVSVFNRETPFSWDVTFYFKTTHPLQYERRISSKGLRDSITGGNMSNGGYNFELSELESKDDFQSLFTLGYRIAGVRPTPPALHLKIDLGEPEIHEIPVSVPFSFEVNGVESNLLKIMTIAENEIEPSLYDGEDIDVSGSYSGIGEATSFHFDKIPFYDTEAFAITNDGEKHSTFMRGNDDLAFRVYAEDIHHIELHYKPNHAHVKIDLPQLPLVSELNKDEDDLMRMQLPPVLLTDERDVTNFFRVLLQAGYGNHDVDPLPKKTQFPLDLNGMSVGELLEWENNRYPPHEVVTAKSPTHTRIERKPIGSTRKELAPIRNTLYAMYPLISILISFIVLILICTKVPLMIITISTASRLKDKGYQDFTFWDIEKIVARLFMQLKNIPYHDDLGSIPGYDPDKPEDIIRFVKERYDKPN